MIDPAVLRDAAVVFDIDGVVADVRATYRAAYRSGIAAHLRVDLGLALPRGPLFTLRAAHLLKRDPRFNAPRDMVAVLLRLSLLRVQSGAGPEFAAEWIARALAAGELGAWQGLTEASARRLPAGDPELALRRAREAYVGSAAMAAIFGQPPLANVQGLCRRDRLLIDPQRPPLHQPVGVYTGRTRAEALWFLRRFGLFAPLCADANAPLLMAIDDGAEKPDGLPLVQLAQRLGRPAVIYVGDLPADRDALLHARQLAPQRQWLLGQVRWRGTAAWPQAQWSGGSVNALLEGLDRAAG